MSCTKDISIIIPHRNSIHFLPKLFSSIPVSDKIEILLVDNTPQPIIKDDIGIIREYKLLYSDPARGAGGARNVGIENATGKWLIFADADDYFEEGAFDIFYQYLNAEEDVIYFSMRGVRLDNGAYSTRGSSIANLVQNYVDGKIAETNIRVYYFSPCAKLVRHSLVKKFNLSYDEVPAGNDSFFALTIGYYAQAIKVVNQVVYIVTESGNSLTARKSLEIVKSRFKTTLKCNFFLKKHRWGKYQLSVMYYLYTSFSYGIKSGLDFIILLLRYKQNPFIGYRRWLFKRK